MSSAHNFIEVYNFFLLVLDIVYGDLFFWVELVLKGSHVKILFLDT
jgi:hypothetical protein